MNSGTSSSEMRATKSCRQDDSLITVPAAKKPRKVTNTNLLQHLKMHIMDEICNHPDAITIRKIADAKKLQMDLGTIKERLENNYYGNAEECIKDFNVLFSSLHVVYKNLYLKNNSRSILFCAQVLEMFFLTKLAQILEDEKTLDKTAGAHSELTIDMIQPPVLPPSDRPRRVTNQLQYIQEHVIDALCNHPSALPFLQPFDHKKLNLPEYYKFIRHPMDLASIKKRLENHYYLRAEECIIDFGFIFLNCFTYNKGDGATVSEASNLQFFYRALMSHMPIKEVILDGTLVALSESKNEIIEPTFVPRPTRPGRVTNQLQYIQNHFDALWDLPYACLFHQPVDAKNFPDYYKIIEEPMNLMTIKKRLENNYYWDIAECYDDIDLIVENCRRFSKYVMYCTIDRLNGHHMEGWKHVDCLARSLKNSFLEMITKMPANEIVLE